MADDAPETAEVEFVEIRGLKGAQPLLLARVQRGGRTYAVRSQLAAAGLVHEKDLRAAAASAEHCREALGPELVALKGLERAALPPRTARTALVDVRWLADAFAGAPGLDLLQARMLFGGLQPLPASLPAEEAEEDPDDVDFDEATEPEGARPPLLRPSRDLNNLFFKNAGAAQPYGLAATDLAARALGAHLEAFEAWLVEPVNLERPTAQGAQAGRSAANVKGHLARFLGFSAARADLEGIQRLGLFSLLDGPQIMAHMAFLLRERGVALSTCVQSALALAKARGRVPSRSPAGLNAPSRRVSTSCWATCWGRRSSRRASSSACSCWARSCRPGQPRRPRTSPPSGRWWPAAPSCPSRTSWTRRCPSSARPWRRSNTAASEQRSPCACTGGSRPPRSDQNEGKGLRVSRKEPSVVRRPLYAFVQGHRRTPTALDSSPHACVVATPTGAATAREPRQGAGSGPSPSNEAGLH